MHNITSATRSKYSDRNFLTLDHHRAAVKQIAGVEPTSTFAMTDTISKAMSGAVSGVVSGVVSGTVNGSLRSGSMSG